MNAECFGAFREECFINLLATFKSPSRSTPQIELSWLNVYFYTKLRMKKVRLESSFHLTSLFGLYLQWWNWIVETLYSEEIFSCSHEQFQMLVLVWANSSVISCIYVPSLWNLVGYSETISKLFFFLSLKLKMYQQYFWNRTIVGIDLCFPKLCIYFKIYTLLEHTEHSNYKQCYYWLIMFWVFLMYTFQFVQVG